MSFVVHITKVKINLISALVVGVIWLFALYAECGLFLLPVVVVSADQRPLYGEDVSFLDLPGAKVAVFAGVVLAVDVHGYEDVFVVRALAFEDGACIGGVEGDFRFWPLL